MNKAQRLAFGTLNENRVLPIIQNYFRDPTIYKKEEKYAVMDFIGSGGCRYELKSRTCSSNAFPTTIVGTNKLDYNEVFLFNFTDGLYYIPYDKDKFKSYKTTLIKGKPHLEIPVKDLSPIRVGDSCPLKEARGQRGQLSP